MAGCAVKSGHGVSEWSDAPPLVRTRMSDIVSIELLLDPQIEARMRADWQALADAGMSSLAAHTSPSNRPHVTLLARPALADADFSTALARLPVPVSLIEPVIFAHGDRGVLAWRVALSAEVQALHRDVHAGSPGPDSAHTAPGAWTPHITLARRLRLAAASEALTLLGPSMTGAAIALRRWDSASATVTPLS